MDESTQDKSGGGVTLGLIYVAYLLSSGLYSWGVLGTVSGVPCSMLVSTPSWDRGVSIIRDIYWVTSSSSWPRRLGSEMTMVASVAACRRVSSMDGPRLHLREGLCLWVRP